MKCVRLLSAAVCLAGLLLLSGCGGNDVADRIAPAVEVKSSDDEAKAAGVSEYAPGDEVTMADFEGFLPSDPLTSMQLTKVEAEDLPKVSPQGGAVANKSGFQFEAPVRLMGGEEYVKVDAPGYACPTMADVDEDGKLDLVVGQFQKGKMRFYRNVAANSDTPRFAEESWIMSGEKIAEVPGVW